MLQAVAPASVAQSSPADRAERLATALQLEHALGARRVHWFYLVSGGVMAAVFGSIFLRLQSRISEVKDAAAVAEIMVGRQSAQAWLGTAYVYLFVFGAVAVFGIMTVVRALRYPTFRQGYCRTCARQAIGRTELWGTYCLVDRTRTMFAVGPIFMLVLGGAVSSCGGWVLAQMP